MEVKKVYSGDLNYRNFLGIILAISELLRRLNNDKVTIASWGAAVLWDVNKELVPPKQSHNPQVYSTVLNWLIKFSLFKIEGVMLISSPRGLINFKSSKGGVL